MPESTDRTERPTLDRTDRPRLRLGTRGSALALAQSGLVADALRARGAVVELVIIRTAGDDRPPSTVWGEGAFVMALQAALLDGRVDVAVHSAKDLPTAEEPRLTVAAFPRREDPRDALVCRESGLTLATLPAGALVGTDSPRRVAFLRAARPDLRTRPLNGNVDTRLRRLADGEADALVLAMAGLSRLGLAGRVSEALPPDVVPPAPGQGALAVQVRAGDPVAEPLVARLDDPATRAAVEAERAFLRASGGGCRAPLGALAEVDGDEIVLHAGAAPADAVGAGDAPATMASLAPGTTFTLEAGGRGPAGAPFVAWGERRGPLVARERVAVELAAALARALARREPQEPSAAEEGTGLGATASDASRSTRPAVLVTREPAGSSTMTAALAARGIEAIVVPTIELRPAIRGGALDAAMARSDVYAWVVVTSAAGADALAAAGGRIGTDLAGIRIAAVGAATAAAVARHGGKAAFVPGRAEGAVIGDELPVQRGDRVLLARADAADGRLPSRLRARGVLVDDVVAYRTVEAPAGSREPLQAAMSTTGFAAVAFASASAVRGLLGLLDGPLREAALRIPACCIGPSTAAAARKAGFERVMEAGDASTEALADLVASVVGNPEPISITTAPVPVAAAAVPVAAAVDAVVASPMTEEPR